MLSTAKTLRNVLGLEGSQRLRRAVFREAGPFSGVLKLRERLLAINMVHNSSVIPPVNNPKHPRLAEVPAIHFDPENSSVSALSAPKPGALKVQHRTSGFLGSTLNFLWEDDSIIYAFEGDLKASIPPIEFSLVALDKDLRKLASRSLANLSAVKLFFGGDLPFNLGYFVMMKTGHVIGVTGKTKVELLRFDRVTEKIITDRAWDLEEGLRVLLASRDDGFEVAAQTAAQVMPDYTSGFWVMATGSDEVSAYLAYCDDLGAVLDVFVFDGEQIENGMAIDHTGIYVLTTQRLSKFRHVEGSQIQMLWGEHEDAYYAVNYLPDEAGLISKGSGSSPTLLGSRDDLVVITDRAAPRVNVLVFDRHSGEKLIQSPVFSANRSANENSVVGYRDTIIVQNWWGAEEIRKDMQGMEGGLIRLDISNDRLSVAEVWYNDNFASTATVRLSTATGLLYGTTQTDNRPRPEYSLDMISFQSGDLVHREVLGTGSGYRINMLPGYFAPGGLFIQPTRAGFVIVANDD